MPSRTAQKKILFAPHDFHFEATIRSHGWVHLPPFAWRNKTLSYRIRRGKRVFDIQLSAHAKGVVLRCTPWPSNNAEADLIACARWILRLDEDISPLRQMAERDELLQAALAMGAGRLLRAPTLWEEAVRILCTTNVSWAGTVRMMTKLTQLHGGAFPTPEDVLLLGEAGLRTAGLGYRAPSLLHLAHRLAAGFDLEAWKTGPPPVEEMRREITQWPGFGPYAVAHMLVQLGHYGNLPIDSEVRAFHREVGELHDDESIRKRYRSYDNYAFLAYKLRRIALQRNWIGEPLR